MSDQISVAKLLDSFRFGFCENSLKQEVFDLLERWQTHFGEFISETKREDQVIQCEFSVTIKLRGLGETLVQFFGEDGPNVREAVRAMVRFTGAGKSIGIVVCLCDSALHAIQSGNLIPPDRCVVLSRDDLGAVFTNNNPKEALSRIIRAQIPFRRLIPFSISEPTQGAMFVGRKNELDSLIHENQDFALCGSGGMGKSSLLQQMKSLLRRRMSPRYGRIVSVDLIAVDRDLNAAAIEIAKRVYDSKRANSISRYTELAKFLGRIQKTDARFIDGPIDLVIDEMDSILSLDSQTVENGNSYPFMRILRRARDDGAIRLTISGRNETRRLLNDGLNPFSIDNAHGFPQSNRFKLIDLEPLKSTEAKELLTEPLKALGCEQSVDRKVYKRLADCRGIPFQIQNLGLDIANEFAMNAA